MHTKDLLAQELRDAGLDEMAKKASEGYYHDFLSPLDMPDMQLELDLVDAATSGNKLANEIRMKHHNGDFDASIEESDEWAESAEGQAAIGSLARPR